MNIYKVESYCHFNLYTLIILCFKMVDLIGDWKDRDQAGIVLLLCVIITSARVKIENRSKVQSMRKGENLIIF